MPRKKHTRTDAFILYTNDHSTVKYFSAITVNKFKKILKRDYIGRMTFNLSKIRQMDGRSHVKRTYKLLKTEI